MDGIGKARKDDAKMKPLFHSMETAQTRLKAEFGDPGSFDVVIQQVYVKQLPTLIAYVSGLVQNESITIMLANLQHSNTPLTSTTNDPHYFTSRFNYHGLTPIENYDEALLAILSGRVVFVTEHGYTYGAEFRQYPGRSPEEPDNEKVIRGSRDGFAENIIINAALIRRRIRTPELRIELQQLTTVSKTDIAICYLHDIASEPHLQWLANRIEQIRHDGLTMGDKSLEEWIFMQKFHPVPFVRYSERPDIVAAHLLEGHIAILVDTSPSVILLPTTMFHLLMHAEEYRQAPMIGTMMRWLRYFAVMMSVLLLPFWYLLATNEHHIPDKLKFIGVAEPSEVPLYLQLVIADAGIEFLRMAAIHTPTPLSTAMGLIAGVLIGQIAIDVGLFTGEAVLYTAIVALFSFAIPNYELSISMKVFRQFLLAMTALFAANGFFVGIAILFYYLAALKPMNTPYLWPLVPFFPTAFKRVLIRFPMPNDALRPFITRAKKRKRA